MQNLRVLKVDPYHKAYGLLVPQVAEKMQDSISTMPDLDNIVPAFLARLWGKDRGVLLLAAVDSAGHVKGFTAASFDGVNVTMMQPRLDESAENDAVGEMLSMVEGWAESLKATKVILITRKLDSKWMKKYGYEVNRYVLHRDLEAEAV